MEALLIIVLLMLATVIVVAISDKFNVPWAALLSVIVGMTMLIPGVDHFEVPAEILLPIFLPPLLWALARKISWGVISKQWRTILLFSVALTILSALVITGVALWIMPSIGLAGALFLGAAIAPPDPVAIESVTGKAGIPRRIITSLQTEGLFNDAVSIVLVNYLPPTLANTRVEVEAS